MEYVSSILYLTTKCERDKLQKLQNRVLRQMFNVKMNTEYSTLALHDMSSIQTLEYRRMLQLMVIMFRLFEKGEFQLIHARETRLSARYLFIISMAHTELYNKSPYVIGARKWNSLPNDFQIPDDIISYKRLIRQFI